MRGAATRRARSFHVLPAESLMKRATGFVALAAIVCLGFAGCGGGGGATVKGVLVDESNQPVADAEISFEPFDRDQKIGADVTRSDASGRFEIRPHAKKRGLAPGKYGVFVAKWVNKKTKQAPPAEEMEMEKAAGTVYNLYPRYANREEGPQLTAEVKSGTNDLGTLQVKSK